MIFNTQRLIVRPFTLADATDLEELLSDREVMKFIGDGGFQIEKISATEMIKGFMDSCNESLSVGV
jgi:RimJ/RimL family protein N-acetyltransferase